MTNTCRCAQHLHWQGTNDLWQDRRNMSIFCYEVDDGRPRGSPELWKWARLCRRMRSRALLPCCIVPEQQCDNATTSSLGSHVTTSLVLRQDPVPGLPWRGRLWALGYRASRNIVAWPFLWCILLKTSHVTWTPRSCARSANPTPELHKMSHFANVMTIGDKPLRVRRYGPNMLTPVFLRSPSYRRDI